MSLADETTEAQVLTSLLVDANAIADLPAKFDASSFDDRSHRQIFEAIDACVRDGEIPTQVSVRAELSKAGHAASPGSLVRMRLDRLVASAALTGAEFEQAVARLVELRRRRGYVALGERLSLAASLPDRPLEETEAEHERALYELDARIEPETRTAMDNARVWHEQTVRAMQGGQDVELLTGIKPIDDVLHINPTDFVLLGGRPATGKSVLALQIARSIAGRGLPVLFAGLEMHANELHRRLLRLEAGAFRRDVIRPGSAPLFERISAANDRLSRLPLEFSADPDLDSLLRVAARMKRKRGLALLIVDYIQRARSAKSDKRSNRDQEIGDNAQRLKDFAARYETPIIAVASLSRESSRREDPRPRLEDLRESGRLEYEANAVLFTHLPFKCAGTTQANIMKDPNATEEDKSAAKREAELLVAKQRDAEDSGVIQVRAEFEYARFDFDGRERGEQDDMGFAGGQRRRYGA